MEWRGETGSFLTSRRFSASARCTSRSTHADQNSREVAMDLTWSNQSVWSRMLPGQSDLAHEWSSQPQLPAGSGNQPGPAIGCLRVTRTNGGPAEGLFEEAEGMLHREAPQVPVPYDAQVSRQRTTDPGQPQGPRWQLLIRQSLDLDADHVEGRSWRAARMDFGPGVDGDDTVGGVVQLGRVLRLEKRAVRTPRAKMNSLPWRRRRWGRARIGLRCRRRCLI